MRKLFSAYYAAINGSICRIEDGYTVGRFDGKHLPFSPQLMPMAIRTARQGKHYEITKAYMSAVPEAQRDALAMAIRGQPETG